jgi:hypothetical protein
MVVRSPLVFVDGKYSELPPTDSIAGVDLNQITSSSGIAGSGDLVQGTVTLNFSATSNPSGLYVTNDYIGVDGSALASGTAALTTTTTALSSGLAANSVTTASQALANTALASGNAALALTSVFYTGNSATFPANSNITALSPVGINPVGGVEVVRDLGGGDVYPRYSGYQTFLGIAAQTALSGQTVSVVLPKAIVVGYTGLTPGAFYYVSPTTSGFTTNSSTPAGWTSRITWAPVARAVSSSGLLLLKPL